MVSYLLAFSGQPTIHTFFCRKSPEFYRLVNLKPSGKKRISSFNPTILRRTHIVMHSYKRQPNNPNETCARITCYVNGVQTFNEQCLFERIHYFHLFKHRFMFICRSTKLLVQEWQLSTHPSRMDGVRLASVVLCKRDKGVFKQMKIVNSLKQALFTECLNK